MPYYTLIQSVTGLEITASTGGNSCRVLTDCRDDPCEGSIEITHTGSHFAHFGCALFKSYFELRCHSLQYITMQGMEPLH